jgi:hypothetical protein
MPARNYVWFLYGMMALLLSSIALFNGVVDPYGFYRLVEVKGFNQQKEGVRNKIRYVKALELPLRKPKTIIMGSSRVHDGMNPQHPLLQDPAYFPAYNLGIDMDRVHESLQYLKHAMLHTEVKRVIFGLDFFMFNAAQKVSIDFDRSLVGRKINVADYIATSLVSKDALIDSVRTIKTSRAHPERKEFLGNGYRPGNFVFFKVKNYQKLHYYTNWVFLSALPQQTKYYSEITQDEDVFKDFEEILRICKQHKIDVRLYISPAHAHLDGEGVAAAGKWEMMEGWKRRVVTIADRYSAPLWDFSGYNSVTTEPVRTPMKYYWDSSHFTEVTSDWILKRIFADPTVMDEIPPDLGIRISGKNIEPHLMAIRQDRRSYIEKNQPELDVLSKTYRAALSGEPLDVTRIENMFDN